MYFGFTPCLFNHVCLLIFKGNNGHYFRDVLYFANFECTREITNTREVRNEFDKHHISQCLNWTSRPNYSSHASCYVVNRHFTSDRNDICTKGFSSKVQLILSIPFPVCYVF